MKRARTRPESEYLLGLSAHSLSLRDLAISRLYALRARKSDQRLTPFADQILAVAEVLHAADSRLHNRHLDYFSILQTRRADAADLNRIRSQFEKLEAVLNPGVNKLPFSDVAFGLVREAWAVLSDPEKRTLYENEIGELENSVDNKEKNGNESQSTDTFWTVCPYCYYLYEYGKVFEECCLRCQNCRRAFHGVAVNAPPKSELVEEGTRKEGYYFCWGCFPLGYNKGAESSTTGVEVKNVGQGTAGIGDGRVTRKVKTKAGRIRIRMNTKTVARNTKKIMGSGMRCRRNGMGGMDWTSESGEASEGGTGEGGLEFFKGNDDVFVSIVGNP
ncbi:uncharacterized protein LOC121251022 [Juglans microcarpa x Juglans regia]|uniref:uncharacterized protein LOC121251022 n=1 Tax=Juglans microcarpa x Juglans regia TaxID=2249226 RepID=UPI001B7E2FC7|nr:uncharacterized protein LOC121251022 [Juglans microcarpa x Juglans regia]